MPSNDRAIVGLTMLAHGLLHTYELSIPIFLTVWAVEFGASNAVLGGIVGVGFFLFGLGALPGGVLVDRFGSKRLIVGCVAGMGGAFALLSLAPSLPVIAAALALWGLAASVYHPAGLTLISRGVERRGRALALHGMAGNAGIALGPLVTALLLLVVDWRWVAAALAVPAALATLYALRTAVNETTGGDRAQPPQNAAALWRTSRVLFASGFAVVFGVVVLSGLYYRGATTFLPELLGQYAAPLLPAGSTVEAGRFVYAGLLMVGMGGQYAGGWLTDRMPTERAMAGALLALAALALAFPFVSPLGAAPLLSISAVLGFFLFVVQPLYQATVAEYTPAEARGLSYGYTYLGVFGAGALGAPIAGMLLDASGAVAMFAALAAFAAAGAGLSALLMRRRAGEAVAEG